MSTRQIIKDNQEYIQNLYLNQGKQPTEIAKLLGINHQPIYNLLKKLRNI